MIGKENENRKTKTFTFTGKQKGSSWTSAKNMIKSQYVCDRVKTSSPYRSNWLYSLSLSLCRDLQSFVFLTSPCPAWTLCCRWSHRNWRGREEEVMKGQQIISWWLLESSTWEKKAPQRTETWPICTYVWWFWESCILL